MMSTIVSGLFRPGRISVSAHLQRTRLHNHLVPPAGAFALSVALVVGGPAEPGAQEPGAAERVVRSPIPITLELPAGRGTFQTVQQVLQAAGVPHGLEEAPPGPETTLDYGAPPGRTVELAGLRLGEALDAIVSEDPRYEWEERDGRILVRAAQARSASVLDARPEVYRCDGGDYAEALAALATALMPGRNPPIYRFAFGLSLRPEEGAGAPPIAPRLTLALQNATVLDILEAIARLHGELSWSVSYDADGPAAEHATIMLKTAGGAAMMPSVKAAREMAAGGDRLMIPLSGSLEMALSLYADRTGTQFGLELLPDSPRRRAMTTARLDLTGVPAPEGIARLVALDSRFDWEDAGGIFNVRPKASPAEERSVLDRPVGAIALEQVTAEQVLEHLAALLGDPSPGRGAGQRAGSGHDEREWRRRLQVDREKRLSINLPQASLRQVLNVVCLAHGALSWSFEPQRGETGQDRYTFSLSSSRGWSVSRTVQPTASASAPFKPVSP